MGSRNAVGSCSVTYVEDEWLPHHVMELTTRQGYTYSLYRHIMPTLPGL